MKVYTNTPLTMEEMMELSPTNDALIVLGDYRCRYMAASPGQEIEVDYTYYDPETRLAFGLRKVNKPEYQHLAFRIE